MLLKLNKDIVKDIIADDPVRPHITAEFRTNRGKSVYGLYDADKLLAVICVAYTNEVPRNEYELEYFSQAAIQDGGHGSIAIFYTVWSYEKGAGREVLFAAVDQIKQERPQVKRFVTLSPLTEMAKKFHLKNGAILLEKHEDCQNFEYKLDK